MNSVVTVEDGTKNWITVNQQSVSVIASNNTISVLGSKQGIQGIQGEQGIQGDTATLTETTPFGGGAFTNGYFKEFRGELLAVGSYDLFTVPSGKRLALFQFQQFPFGNSCYLKVKINGVYYRIQTTVSTSPQGFSGNNAGIILDEGMVLAVDVVTATNPLNIMASGVVFDNTSPLKSKILTDLLTGDNTLYAVPVNKSAVVLAQVSASLSNTGYGIDSVSSFNFVADSGGTRITIVYHCPSGIAPQAKNRITGSSAIVTTANSRTPTPSRGTIFMSDQSSIVINVDTGNSAQIAWINILEI
jgi:hypothetical protein